MEEKVEPITVDYLLAANASYTGIRMEQQGTAIVTVMDQLSRTIHTFMDVNGNKLSNSVVMPNALQEKESDGATGLLNSRITGLPDKTIVGHHCKGNRIEDGDNDIILYYTETKGMNLSLFDVENNGQQLPAGLAGMFGNDHLVMYIEINPKTDGAQHITMECVELKPMDYTLNTELYNY